jgi:hypothetical protein
MDSTRGPTPPRAEGEGPTLPPLLMAWRVPEAPDVRNPAALEPLGLRSEPGLHRSTWNDL